MSSESPAAELYSSDGYELATSNNAPIPIGTRGLLSEGTDGTNAHFIQTDGYGNQLIDITDGYNGVVAVKPPNTAATAADTALVVTVGPNSNVPSITEGTTSLSKVVPISAVLINGANNLNVIDQQAVNKLDDISITLDNLSDAITGEITVNLINTQATTFEPLYGTPNQQMLITLAGLASGAAQASQVVDNTQPLYEDVYIVIKIMTAAATVSATGYVNVYGYGAVDNGNLFAEGITGANVGVTLTTPPNLILIGQFNANTINASKVFGPISFCRNYGLDRLPAKWGIVVVNQTGAAFNATTSNFSVIYQGINGQLV